MTRKARLDVLVSSRQRAVRVDRRRLAELVRFVARREGVRLGQVDLAVVGRREMEGLNLRWRGHRGPTDVLSFDLSDGTVQGLHAQVVVCGEVAAEQGPLHGLPVRRELMLYVVHGLLHLMGYEDATIRGGARMHAREDELLEEFLGRPARGPRRVPSPQGRRAARRPSSRRRRGRARPSRPRRG